MVFAEILRGIGAGVTYSLSTYAKKEKQKFDWAKFGTTIAVGGVAGLITVVANLPIEATSEFLVTLGMVPVIENLFKFLYRKVYKNESITINFTKR